jgi:putative holliday junction resolvase
MDESRRCMAIDYGFKRIGVALSDPLGMIARPYAIVHRKTNTADFTKLREMIDREQVSKIVVGLPTDSAGEVGPQAKRVIRWAQKLAAVIDIPISFWDESHSSERAAAIRDSTSAGQRGDRRRSERVDDDAAAVILQEYLDAGGAINEPGRPLNTLIGAD